MFMTKTKTHSDNKVNLKKRSYVELQELLRRQKAILCNKKFVDTLPDKGEKIEKLCAEIEEELNNCRKHEALCKDMASLNIGKDALDTIEWTGRHNPHSMAVKKSQSNVDDDENLFKMLVSHSGINADKIIIKEKPEEPLIKPSDLIEEEPVIKDEKPSYESTEFPTNVERYAKNLCGRIDTNVPTDKRQLLLNKPAKPNKYSTVKIEGLSLKESVTLQYLHENKLKMMNSGKLPRRPNIHFNPSSYRESNVLNFDNILEDSDEDSETLLGSDED